MKRVLIVITGFVIVFSSCSNNHPIAKASDYNSFLNDGIVKEQVKKINEEIEFLEKSFASRYRQFRQYV